MNNQPQTTYECLELNEVGQCINWQVVENNEVSPPLDQSEQGQLLLAILSVMVLVWSFKMLKKAM